LQELDDEITALVAAQSLTPAQTVALEQHRTARRELHAELARLAVALSQHQVASLDQVQDSLPDHAALVYWVDIVDEGGRLDEHWGCVIRGSEQPRWVKLPEDGADSQSRSGHTSLTRQFLQAMNGADPAAELAALAQRLHARRLLPLEQYLDGVTRLYVVPVGRMAGVPLDVLTDRYVVSYVPSGSFLTRSRHAAPPAASTLLALGDPVFPVASSPERPLPPGGLLITQTISGGSAAQAGLQVGDVLLTYAGAELTDADQLGRLLQQGQAGPIEVSIWRDGLVTDRKLSGGRLGVAIDKQPAPQAIAARLEADQVLAAVTRGGDWNELPGTSVEVARLQALVGADQTTALTRSDASEESLEQLRASGNLKDFRYLHFATHGEPNNARAFESALILAQDQITGEIPNGGGKYYDGRLTANEVLENWELNADLVTLSACESALGRPGGGDGLLGFAQAFLLAGSRSVCLSLWKVDDTATALLMDRFYQNLLGKREGLAGPMPKAEALAEAKQWLRNLTQDEAKRLWKGMATNVARGTGEPAIPLVPVDEHPYAHPRDWAAFVLIGSPE
jgi:CHAT domain-containing protein